jgi:hypothetical protein
MALFGRIRPKLKVIRPCIQGGQPGRSKFPPYVTGRGDAVLAPNPRLVRRCHRGDPCQLNAAPISEHYMDRWPMVAQPLP